MKSIVRVCAVFGVLACGPADRPLSPVQAVEQEATSRFGFELRLPSEFLDKGWEVTSWEPPDGEWDRYRSLRLYRQFVLQVSAPPRDEAYQFTTDGGSTVGIGTISWSGDGSPPIAGAIARPVMELRLYGDIPGLTFDAITDTIRHVSFGVTDWDLNGTHVKEIDVDDFIRYGHTNTDVPRIIAKVNGFIYAFYYEGYLVEAERILSGFRTNTL